MTEVSDFLSDLEADVAQTRRAGEVSCATFSELSDDTRAVLRTVMPFLGCQVDPRATELVPTQDLERSTRARIARVMLLRFYADTPNPRWSSKALEDLADAVHDIPGGVITDLLEGLVEIWDQEDVTLTREVANFAKDVAMLCFTRYRASYARSDFSWLVDRLKRRPLPSIAYLAVRTLPVQYAADVKPLILDCLSTSEYAREAASLLDESE